MKQFFLYDLDVLPRNSRVCLYGAGEGGGAGIRLLASERKDVTVLCFIDDYKTGMREGIPIRSLQEVCAQEKEWDLILVTSAYWRDIQRTIESASVRKYRIVDPALLFPSQMFSRKEQKQYAPRFQEVEGLLRVESDKTLYRLIVQNRTARAEGALDPLEYYKNVRGKNGYEEYIDFIKTDGIRTIIEGGVLDGRNSVRFLAFLPADGFLFGFEPQYETYLQSPKSNLLEQSRNVKIYPYALWKEQGTVLFQEVLHNRDGSRIITIKEQDSKTRSVPAVSIDTFVREHTIKRLDFMKLDIEGAELEVLHGAMQTLKSHRPQLAVCIYHRKEDLFEIPLYLNTVLKDYIYRIGHYTCSFWDTVWYALPREVCNA